MTAYDAHAKPQNHYHYEYTIAQADSRSSSSPLKIVLAGHKNVSREVSECVRRHAFVCMSQLEGWCSDLKANTLIDLVLKSRPRIIVEIGVWGGKSLIPMACVLKAIGEGTIFGIDPWDSNASVEETMEEANRHFWSYADHNAILRGLTQKIDQFELNDHIVLIKSSSEDATPIAGIDLLHIDGNHSEKTSYLDVTKWVPLMNSGGWIIFDDMTWCEKGIFTTARAVEWLDQHCIKVGQFSDVYCVWGLWVKP